MPPRGGRRRSRHSDQPVVHRRTTRDDSEAPPRRRGYQTSATTSRRRHMRAMIALLAATALFGAGTPTPARPHASGHSERLAARARRGDRVARTALVEEHMGLVRSIAFRYRNLGIPVEDLVQEG